MPDNRIIEVCSNAEYLLTHAPLQDLETEPRGYWDEIAGDWMDRVADALEQHIPYTVTARPYGERRMLHGWNGAHWKRRYGGIGTMATYSDAEWSRVQEVIDEQTERVLTDWKAE